MFLSVLKECLSTDIIGECSKVDCILYVDVVISLDMLTERKAHRQQLYSQRTRCASL